MQSNNSVEYNEHLDKLLKETKVLTKEMLERFYDAYTYDTATTNNWLAKKLKIIKGRLENGDTLALENDKRVLDKENFLDWIESEYPNMRNEINQQVKLIVNGTCLLLVTDQLKIKRK